MKYFIYLLTFIYLVSCGSKISVEGLGIDIPFSNNEQEKNDLLLVSIEQQASQPDPTGVANIKFDVSFSKEIDPATFTSSDITQSGSATGVVWSVNNTGDNKKFIIQAQGSLTEGTIIPVISAAKVLARNGRSNTESASVDNEVVYDLGPPDVVIEQVTADPSGTLPIDFSLTFSEPIYNLSFDTSDITQSGSAVVSSWSIINSGDNKSYTLRVNSVTTEGTIIPSLNAMVVQDLAGNPNNASTSTDNQITYDSNQLGLTIEKSISETVGSCNFQNQADITSSTPVEFRVQFNQAIDDTSFDISDIVQSGSATITTWTLTNCGDDTNYSLKATVIGADGTIIPSVSGGSVQRSGGFINTASTSVDNSVSYSSYAYTWIGQGADSNWSTGANWLSGSAPGSGDLAYFNDDYCSSCNVNINSSISAGGVLMSSNYSGVITQQSGATITIGSGHWTQQSGTFVGSNSSITMTNHFRLNGGSFTSTSGNFEIRDDITVAAAASFFHNSGTMITRTTSDNITSNIDLNGHEVYNFNFRRRYGATVTLLSDFVIRGDLQSNNDHVHGPVRGAVDIEIYGDLTIGRANFLTAGKNHPTFILKGSANQNMHGVHTTASWNNLPNLTIDKSGGNVTRSGNTLTQRGNFRILNGSVDFSSHEIIFDINYTDYEVTVIETPGVTFSSITFTVDFRNRLNITGDLTSTGNVQFDAHPGDVTINSNANLYVGGNLAAQVNSSRGIPANMQVPIVFNGSGDQSITASHPIGNNFERSIVVNKTGGRVIQNEAISIASSSSVTLNSGDWDMNGHNLSVSNTLTLDSGTTLYENCGTLSYGSLVNNGTIVSSASNPNITISDESETEGTDLVFTVSLSEPVCGSATSIVYTTNNGKAQAGQDFTDNDSTLVIPSGSTSGTITIVTTSDTEFEEDENLKIVLSSTDQGSITDNTGSGIIENDDNSNFVWTGLAGDGNFQTGGNWSGGIAPTGADAAYFDGSCTNCDASFLTSTTVGAIHIFSTYSGTLTQAASLTLNGYSRFRSGNFVGGTDTIDLKQGLGIQGDHVFTSTSGELLFSQPNYFGIGSSATFNHNNGRVRLSGTVAGAGQCGDLHHRFHFAKKIEFYDFTVAHRDTGCNGNTHTGLNVSSSDIIIKNKYRQISGFIKNGTIEVHGDVEFNYVADNNKSEGGDGYLKFTGSANQEYIVQTGALSPRIIIDKPAGSVSPAVGTTSLSPGQLTIDDGSFIGPSGALNFWTDRTRSLIDYNDGSLDLSNSEVYFSGYAACDPEHADIDLYSSVAVKSFRLAFGDSNCNGYGHGRFRVTDQPLNVLESFTIRNGNFESGVINLSGDMIMQCPNSVSDQVCARGGNGQVNFIGTADQYIQKESGAREPKGHYTVNKTSGQVIQSANVQISNSGSDLSIIDGTWNMNGYDLSIQDTLTLNSGTTLKSNCGVLSYGTLVNNGTIQTSSSNPNITIDDVSAEEGNSLVFSVNLTEGFCGSSTNIVYTTDDGSATTANSDYSDNDSTLVIPAGSTSATITINTTEDSNFESDETVFVNLVSTDNGSITDSQGLGTITNDDINPFLWTGLGGDSNWSTGLNWQGGSAPGSGDLAQFDSSCANCNVVIDASVSVGGIELDSSYTGTMTQASGVSITVGSQRFTQDGGTFVGGDSQITTEYFYLNGGSFTSTSGILIVRNHIQMLGGTFLHNNGTLTSKPNNGAGTAELDFNSGDLYHFSLERHYNAKARFDTDVIVRGDYTIAHQHNNSGESGGRTIEVYGDLNFGQQSTRGSAFANGLMSIKLVGGANQTINRLAGYAGAIPSFEIDKSAGLVTFPSSELIFRGHFKVTNGSVDMSEFSLTIVSGDGGGSNLLWDFVPNGITVKNLKLSIGWNDTLTTNSNLTVLETLRIEGPSAGSKYYGSGIFTVKGNIETFKGATGTYVFRPGLTLDGTSDQVLSGPVNLESNVFVDKSSGLISLSSDSTFTQLRIVDGVVDMSGNDLDITSMLIVGNGVGAAGSAELRTNCGTLTSGAQFVNSTDGVITSPTGNPSISISDSIAVTEGNTHSFDVVLSEGYCSGSITVDWELSHISTNNQDFSGPKSGSLSFSIGETKKTIDFSSTVDSTPELDEEFTVILSNNSAGTISDELGIGTVLSDDAVSVTWTGLGPDDNWSTAGNWSTGVVPTSSDYVQFDGTCTNCNATIDTSISIRALYLASDYTGTITQASGQTISLGQNISNIVGLQMHGGTFVGSDANITVNSDFVITGGSFTSTSALLDRVLVQGTPGSFSVKDSSFIHNNGTVRLSRQTWASGNMEMFKVNLLENGEINFYNLILDISDAHSATSYNSGYVDFGSDVIKVANNFELTNGEIQGGEIHLGGDLKIDCPNKDSNYKCAGGGTTRIIFNGDSSQEYEFVDVGLAPTIVIDTTGSVSPKAGTNEMRLTDFELINGTFNAPAIMNFNTFWDSGSNPLASSDAKQVTSEIKIVGGTFNHNNGLVVLNKVDNLTNARNAYTIDITSSWNLYDFKVDFSDLRTGSSPMYNNHTATINTGKIVVENDFSFDNGYLLGGQIDLKGSASFDCQIVTEFEDCAGGGTTNLIFNGSVDQNVSFHQDLILDIPIEVDKSSGLVIQTSNGVLGSFLGDLTLSQGTWDMRGFNLNVGSTLTIGSGTTMESNCGNLTYGSLVNNGTLNILGADPITIASSVAEEGEELLFNVSMSSACNYKDVVVNYSLNDITTKQGIDYTYKTGSLTFTKGTTTQAIKVQTIDDSEFENQERFSLSITSDLLGGSSFGAVGIINDNDVSNDQPLKIAIANNHSCTLFGSGEVKCLGNIEDGKLGLGYTQHIGEMAGQMGDNLDPVNLGSGLYATSVAISTHSCAILNNGKVKCWGGSGNVTQNQLNLGKYNGEMGDNLAALNLSSSLTVSKLSTSPSSSCTIFSNGKVKCWGDGTYGKLGYENGSSIGGSASDQGDALKFVDLGSGLTATDISMGSNHTCAILNTGKIKCWGRNLYGALGLGHTDDMGDDVGEMGDALPIVDLGQNYIATDISLGNQHACAILSDDISGPNVVKCWGRGSDGQLGSDSTNDLGDASSEMGDNLVKVNLGPGRTAKKISVGNSYACAILDDDSLKCWGNGTFGKLGTGSTDNIGDQSGEMAALAPVDLGTGRSAKDVTATLDSTCVHLDDDSLKCFGNVTYGRLGYHHSENIGDDAGELGDALSAIDLGTGRSVKKLPVSLNSSHFCVILDNDDLKCFGNGDDGRLGLEHMARGDKASELGSGAIAASLGSGVKAIDIAVTDTTSCVVTSDGRVKCFGDGAHGQLGNGSSNPTCVDSSNCGDNLPYATLPVGRKALQIKSGGSEFCVLLDDFTLSCWGNNLNGDFGQASNSSISTPIVLSTGGKKVMDFDHGENHMCAIFQDSSSKCWGYGANGRLVNANDQTYGNDAGETIEALAAIDHGSKTPRNVVLGSESTCFVYTDHSMKCWGDKDHGHGQSTRVDYGDDSSELGDLLPQIDLGDDFKVHFAASGGYYARGGTCAMNELGKVKCFGNTCHPLGYIWDTGTSNCPGISDMGNSLPFVDFGDDIRFIEVAQSGMCAITISGAIKCYGVDTSYRFGSYANDDRYLGDELAEVGADSTPIDFGSSSSALGAFRISGVSGGSDVVDDSYLGNDEPSVSWSTSSSATNYKVTIYESDQSTVKCAEQSSAATSYAFVGCSLTDGQTYYISLISEDGSSNTRVADNNMYAFSVSNAGPSTFNILGVTNGLDTTLDANLEDGYIPTLNWESSVGANRYDIAIYNDAGKVSTKCSPISVDPDKQSHTFSDCSNAFTSADDGSTFYAEVIAVDVYGNNLDGSNSLFAFSISDSNAPSDFSVTGITGNEDITIDNELTSGTWATVNWNDTTGESSYDVTIYTDAGGSSVICSTVSVPMDTTSYSFDNCELTNGVTYYAKVLAIDTFTSVANDSGVLYSFNINNNSSGSFSIEGIVGVGGDTTKDENLTYGNIPVVSWSASSGATSYDIAIFDESDKDLVCQLANVVGTSHTFEKCFLQGNSTYHVRLYANSAGDTIEAVNSSYKFYTANYPLATIDDVSVTEGSNLSFTVSLSKTWTADVELNWNIASIEAIAGIDFVRNSGTLSITTGNTSGTITISTIDDSLAELDKRLIVSLYDATNATVSKDSIGIGTIQSDDAGVNVNDLALSINSTCARSSDGNIKCWGVPGNGLDGGKNTIIGDHSDEMGDNLPKVSLPSGRSASAIATSNYNACVLLDNGTVTCWGNSSSALGVSSSSPIGAYPGTMGDSLNILDFSPQTVTKIVSGLEHFCALKSDGNVLCWGSNSQGQLGLDSTSNNVIVSASTNVDLGTGRTAKDIAAGGEKTCAILDNDLLKCWGEGQGYIFDNGSQADFGRGGSDMGDNLATFDFGSEDRVKKVSVGDYTICAILFDDSAKCWGDGAYGRLGQGDSSVVGDVAGELATIPAIDFGSTRYPIDVRSNTYFNCFILDNNQVTCFGGTSTSDEGMPGFIGNVSLGNQPEDLGDNIYIFDFGSLRTVVDLTIGPRSLCALLDNNDYKCIGYNEYYGNLGAPGISALPATDDGMGDNLPAVDISSTNYVSAISSNYHTFQCVILDDLSVKCFGSNISIGNNFFVRAGYLGREDTFIGSSSTHMGTNLPLVDLGTSRSATTFNGARVDYSMVLDNGDLYLFGADVGRDAFDTGDKQETITPPSGKSIIKHSLTSGRLCVLYDDFTLSCIGSNSQYGLDGLSAPGLFDTEQLNIPIDFGKDRSVIDMIVSSNEQVCAILDNFELKCFGVNSGGTLGLGHSDPVGNTVGSMGDNLPYVDLGTNKKVLGLGFANKETTCAILDDESIKCFGGTSSGTAGQDSQDTIGDGPGEMGDSLSNVYIGGAAAKALKICTADGRSICSLIDQSGTKEVRCWGEGYYGQLGNSSSNDIGKNSGDMAANSGIDLGTGRTPVDISCGNSHNCALLDNGDVKCWGRNSYGQLGIGDILSRGDDASEMGDNLPAVDIGF